MRSCAKFESGIYDHVAQRNSAASHLLLFKQRTHRQLILPVSKLGLLIYEMNKYEMAKCQHQKDEQATPKGSNQQHVGLRWDQQQKKSVQQSKRKKKGVIHTHRRDKKNKCEGLDKKGVKIEKKKM